MYWQGEETISLQTMAGQRFSTTCFSYSARKYFRVERTGLAAVWPSPQSEASLTERASSSSRSMSLRVAWPSVIFLTISHIRWVPSRQDRHLPQDSSRRKLRKYLATSTMQVFSSMTIMPPEPMIEPAWARLW